MKKKEIINLLKSNSFSVKKKLLSSYDFEVSNSQNTYALKIINLTSNHQVTINSQTIWQIKRGKISGLKFQEIDSKLINIKDFVNNENKIVFFTERPYKILKHINESDIVDVSSQDVVNDILLTTSIEKVLDYMN
ncbi:MAG: hypothetical protein JXR62_02040 [Bacilli bacterium]|nr:hypothetical protein [Bacilli bacterium]